MLKVEGYRKKKLMKDSAHTALCMPGTAWRFHRGVPLYRWLMKYTCST
jgi:hypothetical protein